MGGDGETERILAIGTDRADGLSVEFEGQLDGRERRLVREGCR